MATIAIKGRRIAIPSRERRRIMMYMLDTNVASHVIKGDIPVVRARLASVPMRAVVVSAVTKGELLYGVARRGHPKGLATRVHEFLIRVEVLPWSGDVAEAYGELRAECEAAGIVLSPLDMMIAAHARATDAILVTRDRAFSLIGGRLKLEDWTVEDTPPHSVQEPRASVSA